MSRYRGPHVRISRRLGPLNGLTRKNSKVRKNSPGQHGKDISKQKIGPYNRRLREKQKLKFNYGLSEKQLLIFVKKARKSKGSAGLALLEMLEMRLDSVAFRFGWGNSIMAARQLVNHGHILVNNRTVNIPSFICKTGDKLSLKPKIAKTEQIFSTLSSCPKFLQLDTLKTSGKIIDVVKREDFTVLVDELLIVEYYSRK